MMMRLAAVLLSLVLAAGAASAQDKAASTPRFSGFLSDYSMLKPANDREGVLLFVNKSDEYRPYTKVLFDPLEIYLAPNPDYKGVQPDALKRMADSFHASFKRALEPQYQVVNAPGPGVFRIRGAITGVQPVKPPLNPTDFIPIKALFNVARSSAGAAPMVAEMTAELEVLDANGKRVIAGVATRKGDKTLQQGSQVTWKELEAITDYWAKGLRQRLDEVRGITAN